MRFGPVAIADALGAILAHSTRAGGRALPKGRALDANDIDALAAAGVAEVIVGQLEADEVGEDTAAGAIAAALAGSGLRVDPARTGRANVRAASDGLVLIDVAAIARANAIEEAITIATVRADHPARASEIVATVKVIPFAVRRAAVDAAIAALGSESALGNDRARDADTSTRLALSLAPWRARRAGLVLTQFSTTPVGVLDRAAAAQRTRLSRLGSEVARELRVAHDVVAVSDAIEQLAVDCDPILVLGASAIIDRRDVIPAALERAGGAITRFGMPVDPGNLMLHGTLRGATFIGLPGCARSLARSGCDWVLERAVAGLPIDSASIAALGVGGLLDESSRPSPREESRAMSASIAAVVLAAGKASRMGDNKLLLELDGHALVRHVVLAALASRAHPVVVVTGNDADRVREALSDLDVRFVHNPDFATGMASSLRAGIAAVGDAAGALVCLGDMPRVTARHLDALIASFEAAHDDGAIIVPTCERKRGNPVLWGRRHFASIAALGGDVGARALIEQAANEVVWLAIDDPAILVDVDTPAALSSLRSETR
jgi:molybdenum cofactor cytidylyltransferase